MARLVRSKINTSTHHKTLIVVLDGIGLANPDTALSMRLEDASGILPDAPWRTGNAVNAAYMPCLFSLLRTPLSRTLRAHGPAVGLPSWEDMGNSEVGHNALGAGRIFAQGAKLVNEAIDSGAIFNSDTWRWLVMHDGIQAGNNALHLLGLFSDGNVHSHIQHLFALIKGAKQSGVKKVRLHLLLDGRDVPPTSALTYVGMLEEFLAQIVDSSFDCQVASGGGRMFVTMDRYESDWRIVERGYAAHVCGEGRMFSSMREAIETIRAENPSLLDQDFPPFVIGQQGEPVGRMGDGDAVVLFNFRGDRAIQISKALTYENFSHFPRKVFPKVRFAGMMQYDGDLKLPERFLVSPPAISDTIGELLAEAGIKQFACSETQKYGHVTYFWNGNRSGKFNEELETYVEIPSDLQPFSERPWMKAAEIADATIRAMETDAFQVGRINFANGDMVGHTGDFAAAIVACSAVDLQLARILETAKRTNTVVIVTADHGNADEMFERDKKTGNVVLDASGRKKSKTSHTLNPVPFAIFNAEILPCSVHLRTDLPEAGLGNVAATALLLAGFEPPEFYDPALITLEKKTL